MKDIAVPSAELKSALAENGWRVDQVEEPDEWWARERWHLGSDWSPQEATAFITFLADPQDSHPGSRTLDLRDVWAIVVSTDIAPDREAAETGGRLITLGGQWRPRIPELVWYLNNQRVGRAT